MTFQDFAVNRPLHILVLDPVPYRGGTKVTGEIILAPFVGSNAKITLVSADTTSWDCTSKQRVRPLGFKWLTRRTSGCLYFVRQLLIALTIVFSRLRFGKIDVGLGLSGPGVDLGLYLARLLLDFDIIQLVNGPVAPSRTNGRALIAADRIYYLSSTRPDMRAAMRRLVAPAEADRLLSRPRCHELRNGLPDRLWPETANTGSNRVLWAASLLEWKRLDLLLAAIEKLPESDRPGTDVCYIRPQDTSLAVCEAELPISGVSWHESPSDLDAIRANCGIFVSTSRKEPFGMSILEALAAGLAVIIPADGAFWDRILVDGVSCYKFLPNDADGLAKCIGELAGDPQLRKAVAMAGQEVAQSYRASRAYAHLRSVIAETGPRDETALAEVAGK